MSAPLDTTRVVMQRPHLDGVGHFALDQPFRIRPYEPGDEARWYAIHRVADPPFTDTEGLFVHEFGADAAVLAARQLYLCDGDAVVGTASAWHDPGYADGTWARVHWVAIDPAYQGRGLSKPLLARVLRVAAGLGHRRAFLTTQRFRTVAIGLYASFGFVEV